MSLSERDRARFARHLLLSQLGEAGQERLLASRLSVPADADAGALEVASTYLSRAGVEVLGDGGASDHSGGLELTLGTAEQVARVAGTPALLEAARALVGALSAVAAIKRVVGLPEGATQDFLFAISSEDA